MQKLIGNKPYKVVTDRNETQLKPDEATYIKNYKIAFNRNQNKSGQEGGNQGVGTALNSTVKSAIPDLFLPVGKNICIGTKDVDQSNRMYVAYWNENGNHGIFRLNGDTNTWQMVIIDRRLGFSLDPKHALPPHRWDVTQIYSTDQNDKRYLKDEIIKFTDANVPQRWINTESSIATNGYDAVDFPYYSLFSPHYDFEEFIDWAVRPPMFCPTIKPIERTLEDINKVNNIENQSIQIAYLARYTDGRTTTLSPHSTPFVNKLTGCTVNDRNTPRCLEVEFDAGSAHVEELLILKRNCGGQWQLYDTMKKYDDCGVNSKDLIGDKFWLRKNPWADYNYDAQTNRIKYVYCGDKECRIFSQDDANRLQSDLPLLSTALTYAGDASLLMNNLRGYDNFGCEVTDKIKISAIKDEQNKGCSVKTVNIKLYAYLCAGDVWNQFLFKNGETSEVKFGGMQTYAISDSDRLYNKFDPEDADFFNLRLGDKNGFICYLAGTPYYSIGKQIYVSGGTRTEVGPIDISNESNLITARDNVFNGSGYYIQEFEFNVPAGNYIARLASHNAEVSSLYQKTSTYTIGIIPQPSVTNKGVNHRTINHAKEIQLNVCSSDFDGFSGFGGIGCFYVFTPWRWLNVGNDLQDLGRFITGYLQESSETKLGIEYVRYNANHGAEKWNFDGVETDHNGFFFSMSADGLARESQAEFWGVFNCAQPGSSSNFKTAIQGKNKGYFPEQDIFANIALGSYRSCNRIIVNGSVKECNTLVGLAGVAVTITGGGTFNTDAEGNFTVIVHSRVGEARKGKLFYNGSGECSFTECDCGCVFTENYDDSTVPCVNCNERLYPTVFNKKLKLSSSNTTSLKSGGRYGISVKGLDLAGRMGFENTIGYVDIPTIMENGGLIPSKILWEKIPGLKFPSWVKWVIFSITANLNNRRYLQWVGDSIEFLDRNGSVTPSGNGAIAAKISIQSLLDFNVNNNFSTTTGYQFVQGDKLRIYDDGKGEVFALDPSNGFMEYEIRGTNFNTEDTQEVPDGKTIVIDYDTRLLKLDKSCGFWMEIISPRNCDDLEKYCEICGVYPVVDGEIQANGAIFSAYDTFYINRTIVVPGCSGNTQSHPFESGSVSDYWGEGCTSCGRVSIKNENAKQTWYRTESIRSDEFVNEGLVNGLGTFRQENIKRFKGLMGGGIVAGHGERGMIFFLLEGDWFITNFQQEFVKVTAQGLLETNLDQNISNPNQKVGDSFGCAYEDTSTIDFFDKSIFWIDSKNSVVCYNTYGQQLLISDADNASYFLNKLKYINNHDSDLKAISEEKYLRNLFERSGMVDPKSGAYHLTFRPRRNNSNKLNSFINNEQETFLDMQETFVFDVAIGSWSMFTGFAPEFYGRLPKKKGSKGFFSFVNATPYEHNNPNAGSVNTFYGIKTDQIIETVFLGEPSKDKLFQRVVMECERMGYSIENIRTSNKNQFSYIPLEYMVKKSSSHFSRILTNTNVYVDPNENISHTLIDGGSITGFYIKLRFVGNRYFMDIYRELDNLWVGYTDREKSKK